MASRSTRFGIYALILRHQPDVREQFRRAARPRRSGGPPVTDRDPDEFTPRGRASRYDDARDDYDDDFAVVRTPLQMVRRKVVGPAVAFIPIGVLGIVGTLLGALAAILEFTTLRRPPPVFLQAFTLALLLLGTCLFAIVLVGGIQFLHFRRRWLVLTAAYIVTGLSLAGCYGILFYPFGIWALVGLYQPDVREQFRRPPDRVRDRDD
jgi:hypothetical protein